mmetsp:Transcript_29373/g.28970  ORF Transcript_29373/g.28970 Transcript_29373/m.28970 type:complete len:217 (-) Transcript_29373:8-658(-)
MAPEVMCRQNHGIGVDYFAVGVIAYECMFGRRPYIGRSRREIRDHILNRQVAIKKGDVPRNWSLQAADFINKMILRKPSRRLGYNGPSEVKNHPWLVDFPWDDLFHGRVKPRYLPKQKEDNFDSKNINEEWKDQDSDKMKENTLLLRRNSVQNLFNGYYYDATIAAIAGSKLSSINSENKTAKEVKPEDEGKKKEKDKNVNTSEITTKAIVSKPNV